VRLTAPVRPTRLTLRTCVTFALSVFSVVLSSRSASAQYTWNLPAGGNWNAAGNWVGGLPVSGTTTTLTFGSAATQASTYTANNDIGAFTLNALTVNNTAGTVSLTGGDLAFGGAAPTATVTGAGNMSVANLVTLGANLTVAGAGSGGLTFSGAITGGTNDIVKTSAGALTLSGGGSLNRIIVQAGNLNIIGGTLGLTVPTGIGNVDAGLQLATAAGQTVSATVSGGATVNVTDNTYIADAVGSTATLTVTGAGTVYNNVGTNSTLGRFGVGNQGAGTLNVMAGAEANVNQLFAARLAGSSGTVLVDGAGSLLLALTQLSFGTAGAGVMTVQNGGTAISRSINIGRTVGAGISGTVTVTGAGSTMIAGYESTNGTIVVGSLGLGTLNVQNGGAVRSGNETFAGQMVVGVGDNTGGTVGTLNVTTGGTVTVHGNFFASTVGPTQADITIDGTGSLLAVSNHFSLSGGAAGGGVAGGPVNLNVLAGGRITCGTYALIGQNAGAGVTGTVSGAGSLFSIAAQLQIVNGTNSLTVSNGGNITSTGAVFIGSGVSGTALGNVTSAVTVTGAGSVLTTPSGINVGGGDGVAGAGTASLTVDSGGSITATSGLFVYNTGTVNVNAGGTLSVGNLSNGLASGPYGTVNVAAGQTVNITNGSAATYTGLIAGAGSVTKSGAGTQTFAGANTYSGGTIVTGGNLTVTNASALGTGNIAIGTGATLGGTVTVNVPAGRTISGTGKVLTPVTVAGTVAPGGAPATGPGILQFGANVTFLAGSSLSVTVNGNTPGNSATNYSQIVLDGVAPNLLLDTATLSCTFGYTPANTDRLFITVINDPAGTNTGTLSGVVQNGSITLGSFSAQISYFGNSGTNELTGGNDTVLYNFAPVPEPTTIFALGAATLLAGGAIRRRRRGLGAPATAC
jgi:fibronectin-binding autotransporter adhesin